MNKAKISFLVITTFLVSLYALLPPADCTYATGFFVEGFDAPLNRSVWYVDNYSTAYAWHRPEYISVSNSTLRISIPGGQRVGGGIKTLRLFGHNLFGVRMKAAVTPTSDSGFCTYYKDSSMLGCDQIAMEIFGNAPNRLSCGMWKDGKRQRAIVSLWFDATRGFHNYECAWYSNCVKFYVDGRLIATLSSISCLPTKSQYFHLGAFSWSGFLDPPSNISGRADFATAWVARLYSTQSSVTTNTNFQLNACAEVSIEQPLAEVGTNTSSINPADGLHVSYQRTKYSGNVLVLKEKWDFTYKSSSASDLVYVKQTIMRGTNHVDYWFTVSKTSRWVGNGSSWWNLSWYIGWIPTNVYVGYRFKWWMSKGTVLGTRYVTVNGSYVATWLVDGTYPDSPYRIYAYYNKQTGMLVKLTTPLNSLIQTSALA